MCEMSMSRFAAAILVVVVVWGTSCTTTTKTRNTSSMPTPPASAARPADVDGWGGAKWGMTRDEVRAVFPDATGDPLRPETLDLGRIFLKETAWPMNVWVQFNINGKLKAVYFSFPSTGIPDDTLRTMMLAMRGEMAGRYGRPDKEYPGVADVPDYVEWYFPSAKVWSSLIGAGYTAKHYADPQP